jgi:hypothetical protein
VRDEGEGGSKGSKPRKEVKGGSKKVRNQVSTELRMEGKEGAGGGGGAGGRSGGKVPEEGAEGRKKARRGRSMLTLRSRSASFLVASSTFFFSSARFASSAFFFSSARFDSAFVWYKERTERVRVNTRYKERVERLKNRRASWVNGGGGREREGGRGGGGERESRNRYSGGHAHSAQPFSLLSSFRLRSLLHARVFHVGRYLSNSYHILVLARACSDGIPRRVILEGLQRSY